MIRFDCDYSEGAHPKILKRIVEVNYEQNDGYSKDKYTESAVKKIKKALNNDNVDVHIISGGTQANLVVISSFLTTYQGVICTNTGHINVHEAGAIESAGNKVIPIDSKDGKITVEHVQKIVDKHYEDDALEFKVMPKMLFITIPTECGTSYTKRELEELYNCCKKNNMYLYIDGARLGYGLAAKDTDIKMEDLTKYCDVMYIGGTKCGALFGEAIVIVNDELKPNFRYYLKQRGALLAKGWLLGIQFDTLFENDLYLTLGVHAVELAMKIKEALVSKGYNLLYNSNTNQLFVEMSDEEIEKLFIEFGIYKWERLDNGNWCARICTSWATTEENVDKLISKL